MKLFVSWSGQLSREVAEILHKFLPLMIQELSVFMSKNDIESGSRWSLEIAEKLAESQFSVICLTPDNLSSPWILFEAGALTKQLEGRACGLLLNGLKPVDITGPLSQFQHRVFEKQDFYALLKDINSKSINPLAERQLEMVFEKWWGDIENAYNMLIKKSTGSPRESVRRESSEILEEILLRVRRIEQTMVNTAPTERNVIELLERTVDSLSESQQNMLYDLIKEEPLDNAELLRKKYSDDDINTLMRFGLIAQIGDRFITSHRVIQQGLSEVLYSVRSKRVRNTYVRAVP